MALYDEKGSRWGARSTMLDGTYTWDGLPSGQYRLRTENTQDYVDQWYKNKPVQLYAMEQADLVDVRTTNATNIDFALVRGRTISGKITKPGGAALPSSGVWVYNQAGTWSTSVAADAAGNYEIKALGPAIYKIRTYNYSNYLDEWYDNKPLKTTTREQATPVDVRTSNASAINFELTYGRVISGKLTAASGQPLGSSSLQLYAEDGTYLTSVMSQPDGNYGFYGLWPGKYKLRTNDTVSRNMVDEWYDNKPVLLTPVEQAALIDVSATDKSNINFVLAPGKTISGKVTAEQTGGPIGGAEIELYTAAGAYASRDTSRSDGSYYFSKLPAAKFRLGVTEARGYVDEWYNDVPMILYGPLSGNLIDVTAGNATNTNVALATGRTISGKVTFAPGAPKPTWFEVELYPEVSTGWDPVVSTLSESDGTYRFEGLLRGRYRVRTSIPGKSPYIDEWYNNKPVQSYQPDESTVVDVIAGNAANINFSLELGRSIAGKVTKDGGGALENVVVRVEPASG